MFNGNSAARGRPDLFVSAKTPTAIRARHPALREALVQASLDPAVRSIGYVASALVASDQVELDAVVVTRDDGLFHLDVVQARRIRDVDEERIFRLALIRLGIASLVVTAEDLRAEPMRANRDLVWSHRGRAVAVDLRLSILQLLADDGPMPLDRLLRSLVCGRDPAAAVMALACDDLLELDLTSDRIGPTTVVRSRS
jgi:hypothetical protein